MYPSFTTPPVYLVTMQNVTGWLLLSWPCQHSEKLWASSKNKNSGRSILQVVHPRQKQHQPSRCPQAAQIIACCSNVVRQEKNQPMAAVHLAVLHSLKNLRPWHCVCKNNINHAILGAPRWHGYGISWQWATLPQDAMNMPGWLLLPWWHWNLEKIQKVLSKKQPKEVVGVAGAIMQGKQHQPLLAHCHQCR